MKILLDTHTIIWHYSGNTRLSLKARQQIDNGRNQTFVSMVSFWEMAIKIGLGKMDLKVPLNKFATDILANGVRILPVELEHVYFYQTLPPIHGDPFDRLLISQSLTEGMDLVSVDGVFDQYFEEKSVQRIW